jgi:hypothetical protein
VSFVSCRHLRASARFFPLLKIARMFIRRLLELDKVGMRELVCESSGHAGMLEHVLEGQVLDHVVDGVDVVVRVLECRLDDKRTWVAGLVGGGVITAGIAALGLNERNVAVLCLRSVRSQA